MVHNKRSPWIVLLLPFWFSCLTAVVTIKKTEASSWLGDPSSSSSSSSGSGSGSGSSSSAPFLYRFSQTFDVDLSSSCGEEEEDDFDENAKQDQQGYGIPDQNLHHHPGDTEEEKSNVVSLHTPDASCCFVSSHALMSEQGQQPPCELTLWEDVSSDDENENDDDDDDDDDGHSSMLSNASLKRSRNMVSIGGSGDGIYYNRSGHEEQRQQQRRQQQQPQHRHSDAQFAATARRQLVSSTEAVSNGLRLRGGAEATSTATYTSSSSLGSEVTKKLFVTALVTLVYEGVIGHFLEFIKIQMQVADYATYAQVIQAITAEKGIAGLWDGFVPWGVVQAVFKGAVFGLAHAVASGYLLPLADEGKLPLMLALTLAGGIGGGFQGYVLSPTLLLKTRVMTNPVFREKMSLLRTTWLSFCVGLDVVKTEGLLTLMKGANVFATKRVFDWATRFFFSDLFESLFKSMKGTSSSLTIAEKSMASFLGGVASTCSTLPLDVLVAKTQDAKKAGVKVSAWRLFRDELDEKGWSGLRKSYMQGFEARLAHVTTTTVGTLIVFYLCRKLSANLYQFGVCSFSLSLCSFHSH